MDNKRKLLIKEMVDCIVNMDELKLITDKKERLEFINKEIDSHAEWNFKEDVALIKIDWTKYPNIRRLYREGMKSEIKTTTYHDIEWINRYFTAEFGYTYWDRNDGVTPKKGEHDDVLIQAFFSPTNYDEDMYQIDIILYGKVETIDTSSSFVEHIVFCEEAALGKDIESQLRSQVDHYTEMGIAAEEFEESSRSNVDEELKSRWVNFINKEENLKSIATNEISVEQITDVDFEKWEDGLFVVKFKNKELSFSHATEEIQDFVNGWLLFNFGIEESLINWLDDDYTLQSIKRWKLNYKSGL